MSVEQVYRHLDGRWRLVTVDIGHEVNQPQSGDLLVTTDDIYHALPDGYKRDKAGTVVRNDNMTAKARAAKRQHAKSKIHQAGKCGCNE